MKIAAIDVGTNTILLLVAEIDAAGRVTVLAEEQQAPRLGRRVDATGRLDHAVFPAVTSILDGYLRTASSHGADRVVACATSAVRDAVNREEFISKVKLSTGLGIRVIGGAEESELTYAGAVSGLGPGEGEAVVLDIGGGSTEICYRRPGRTNGGPGLMRYSLDIGSVRITERYFTESPPAAAGIATARERILEELAQVANTGLSGYTLVGVAGTATTMAGILLGLGKYDREAIEGFRMSREKLATVTARLLGSTPAGILAMSPMAAGREDILAAGALILSTVAEHFRFPGIRVSTRGLRYGIAIREWERERKT
jgi:exopolyphosphatase/guanosine-5'-triphosphate,3'-diphosphate pyrophosphatase